MTDSRTAGELQPLVMTARNNFVQTRSPDELEVVAVMLHHPSKHQN